MSDFIYEQGEAVDVGIAGEHDYEFAGGESITDNGGSNFVFVSGTGLGGGMVIDDFERGDLSPYIQYGDKSATISTVQVYEGTYSMETGGNEYALVSYPGDGLNYYPVRGDVVEYYCWLDGSDDLAVEIDFCVQDHGNGNEYWYEAALRNFIQNNNPGSVHVGKRTGNVWDIGPVRSGDPMPSNTWLRCRVEIGDPTISVTGYYPDGSGGWVAEATVSLDDTAWDSGGFGWHTSQSDSFGGPIYSDFARKVA